ncbi:MAG TPA: HAD family hydrolase [Polyangiaceae bacterium]|nr:HAD family hydrolase [Polyangiaceae bacterium]
MSRPTVLLFDVDGTLVSLGGVGRRAFERTFARLHGRADILAQVRFDGATDRATTRTLLELIGAPATDPDIDAILAAYLGELQVEIARSSASAFVVHPGVERAVHASRQRGAAVGLGTGNIREGARLKLECVNLFHHFDFGGFGDDHELRVELIRRGAERGAARLGRPLPECRVLVIGDTPKDVDAARGIGAESLGVGTGSFTAQQLLDHGATYAFDDLTAAGALNALLDE